MGDCNTLVKLAKVLDEAVDSEIQRLNEITPGELNALRDARIEEMKKEQAQRRQWQDGGHGRLETLLEEREFFNIINKSEQVVILFYRSDCPRSPIISHYLEAIARNHLETKFAKIMADKCPFLVERLRIRAPVILCVLQKEVVERIHIITEVSQEYLVKCLVKCDLITQKEEDDQVRKKVPFRRVYKKTIRDESDESSED